ncbi:MAG: phage major capsid protein [Anaerolineae bacterium]
MSELARLILTNEFSAAPPMSQEAAFAGYPVVIMRACDLGDVELPPDLLRRSADLFAGAPVFIDHAGPADAGRAGGRSVRDLAGVLGEVAWQPNSSELTASLQLYPQAGWVHDLIRSAGADPHLGLSADMWVERDGRRVDSIVRVNSVDIVMNPAAGGRFLGAQEERAMHASTVRAQHAAPVPISSASPVQTDGRCMSAVGAVREPPLQAEYQQGLSVRAQHAAPVHNIRKEHVPMVEITEFQLASMPSSPPPPVEKPATTPISASEHANLLNQVAELKLAASGLPQSLSQMIRMELANGLTHHDTLDARIAALREDWSAVIAGSAIQNLGQIVKVTAPIDRLTLAFENLMGLPQTSAHRDTPRLSGIRELYDTLTGDWDRRGVFVGGRVQLANVTTSTMADVVANVLNKVLMRSYEARPQWWRPIVTEETFPTMQDPKWTSLGGILNLATVAEGGPYVEATWTDAYETSSFIKTGNYIGLTMEMIDKDDIGAIRALPARLAYAAQRTLSASVTALLTGSSGTGPELVDGYHLFDASHHANLLTAALDSDGWWAVVVAMFNNGELHTGYTQGIKPKYCVVPINLERTALGIFTSDFPPGASTLEQNMLRNSASVIVCPGMTDTTDWAAVADPADLAGIMVGYRHGRTPEIFVADDQVSGSMFTNDELRIKVRFIYTVGIANYRALHKSNVTGA